ncbi:uncharacterized protein LOC124404685 [Diprion similis]|uniref:uncharacterized protein LOC124404685 n=1 Tax=Diprion similis TaxID=362088 RepID=UPI001EF794AE|nr:uncharacterized protein LOC124404685 [Diprion similis]
MAENKLRVEKLNIIAINVNSIITIQRRINLSELVAKYKPDFVLLSETKLNSRFKIAIENYTMIRNDRPYSKQGGGTAMLIKNPFEFVQITPVCLSGAKVLEASVVKLKVNNSLNLFIIAAYAPGGHKKEFIPEIGKLFEELDLSDPSNLYILAGDLNAKHTSWQNATNNPRGVLLHKWIHDNEINLRLQLFGSLLPSYPRGSSFIDICLADNRLTAHGITEDYRLESLPYDSDHNAILMSFSFHTSLPFVLERKTENRSYNFAATDWESFAKCVDKSKDLEIPDDRNLANTEIDSYLTKIESVIKDAVDKIVPKIKTNQNTLKAYTTHEIKNLHKHKTYLISQINKLHKQNARGNLVRLNILKDLLKKTRNKIKTKLATSVNGYWENKIRNISMDKADKMFPQINRLFRPRGSAPIPILTVPSDKENLLTDARITHDAVARDQSNNFIIAKQDDKLNLIGAHFAATNIQNVNLGKPNLIKIVETKVSELKREMEEDKASNRTVVSFSKHNTATCPSREEIPNYFTSLSKLLTLFKNLNNKKSAGYDNIPNAVLKHLPRKIISYYCILFNNALNNMYFPDCWRTAKVIALLKKDKESSNPSSYRPISLLPNISKIFEVVVNKSLAVFCDENEIIPESQFGFRHRHSTIHAISKFTSDICWSLNNSECVAACLIDLEKAFDTVWLDGLFYKLMKKNFPKHLIKMLWVMLHDKYFHVCDGSNTSSIKFAIADGLQQGTVNSPILFNIFNSDILTLFDLNKVASKKAIAFADDLVVYISGNKPSELKVQLQELSIKLIDYYNTWKLKINTSKCETILFRPNLKFANRDTKKNWRNFSISDGRNGGHAVPHKNIVKYLGINIDFQLKFNLHVNAQLARAQKAFNSANRLFYCKYLDKRIKILCYLLLIRPIITYGCPIWFNLSAGTMDKIRVFERKCIRACLGKYRSASSLYVRFISNAEIYNEANINRIDCFILRLIRNHFANAVKIGENNLIRGPFFPNPLYFAKSLLSGFIPPEAFTYLDENEYIQDANNIPIIYHVLRGTRQKQILYTPAPNVNTALMRFNTDLPDKDVSDRHRQNSDKYWWLNR